MRDGSAIGNRAKQWHVAILSNKAEKALYIFKLKDVYNKYKYIGVKNIISVSISSALFRIKEISTF